MSAHEEMAKLAAYSKALAAAILERETYEESILIAEIDNESEPGSILSIERMDYLEAQNRAVAEAIRMAKAFIAGQQRP